MRVLPPPLSVTLPPPSITVSSLTSACFVTVMVMGASPQSKVITPPLAIAGSSADSVQLLGSPLPSTVVGLEVAAAWMGGVHVVGGGGGAPPVPVVAPSP